MEPYYYSRMSKLHQSVYHDLKAGLLSLSPAIVVDRLEGETLSEILLQLRLDCPEIFYVTGFSYRFHPQGSTTEVLPDYLFDKGKIRTHQQAMTARIAKLTRPLLDKPPVERERFVHDFICENVRYDKLKKPYSHEIIGALGQGVAVCEGIAKAVKALCDALGLWCIVAICGNNPEKGIKYRHTWNIVRLEGRYYHLDATFDRTLSEAGPIRYDYFNLGDAALFRDHEPVLFPVPACTDEGKSWYRAQKLAFTTQAQVVSRSRQAIRKKRPLIFQWRGDYLTRERLISLCALLDETAQAEGCHAKVALNWPQSVLQVSFPQAPEKQAFTAQQANEGEAL